ncbi:MAG: GIN domain-containing protein [Bacteroidota bacterium]
MKTLLKNTGLLLMAVLFAISVSAQEKQNLTPPSGLNFNKLYLKGVMNVELVKGDKAEVWVEYEGGRPENADKKVEMKYDPEAKELHLKTSPWKGMSKVYIQYVEIGRIHASTAVDVRMQDTLEVGRLEVRAQGASVLRLKVKVQELETDVSGAASVMLAGYAELHKIEASAAADVNARKLLSEDVVVNASAAADIDVIARNSLHGKVTGNSNVTNHVKAKINEVETEDAASYGALPADTTRFKIGKSRVIIVDGGEDEAEVDIDDPDDDREEFDGHWGGIELGFNGFVNASNEMNLPAEYDFLTLKEEKSILVNINIFEKSFNLIRDHFGLVTGLGLQYNNYRFANNMVITNDSSTIYGNSMNIRDRSYVKSKLVVNYVTLPLFLEYTTHGRHEFHIGAGANFAWKIGDHSKVVYEQGTDRRKVKDHGDFYIRPYKVELTGRIGWGFIHLFGTYSLTELFDDGKGPELYPITAGFLINMD